LGYHVYILKSEAGRSYVGHTKHLHIRMVEHNSGKNKATKGKGPWRLVYQEEFETRSGAAQREMFFKTVEGRIELKEKGIL